MSAIVAAVALVVGNSLVLWAQIQARPTGPAVQVTPVDALNSSADDFVTSIARGGREVYLTSSRVGGRQRLYVVERQGDRWGSPRRIGGEVSNATHAGGATLTVDGSLLLFAAFQHELGGSGRTDLYSARRSGERWTRIANLGAAVNSAYWDSQPCIAADGTLLIFAS
ncbi:MAG: hypothetical protein NZ949_06965, partial [Candidatus Kapabacteria bacterium]|nr:hypothetical protein [Candidatus Kapabacteria bacterium]